MHRRLKLLLAVALLLGAAAALFALQRPKSEPTPAPVTAAPPAAPERSREAKVAASRSFHEAAQKRAGRYPRNSHPLSEKGEDPVAASYRSTPRRSTPGELSGAVLVGACGARTYTPEETVVVQAQLQGASGDGARIFARFSTSPATPLELEGGSEGKYRLELARDHALRADFDGPVEVRLRAELPNGERLFVKTSFLASHPRARLTGRFDDRREGGDLIVGAEVEALEEGRYHVEASLYDAGGAPVAWAQKAEVLGAGRGRIELRFAAAIFDDMSTRGPYELRNVALRRTGRPQGDFAPLVERAHRID